MTEPSKAEQKLVERIIERITHYCDSNCRHYPQGIESMSSEELANQLVVIVKEAGYVKPETPLRAIPEHY